MPRLAIIGAGSLRHSPAVIASLANYFGERELHIVLYDPIAERLELFEMLAQYCLSGGVSSHQVEAVYRAEEALEGADLVIVQLDRDAAAKFSPNDREDSDLVSKVLRELLTAVGENADVLSLLGEAVALPLDRYQVLNWPQEPDEEYWRAMPHQVLRWIRKEDSIFDFLNEYERSPVKRWLEDPTFLPVTRDS